MSSVPFARAVLTGAVLLLFSIMQTQPVSAQACGGLQYLLGLQIVPDGQGHILVPVTLNDQPELMLFDTGGTVRSISRATVTALKLPERPSAFKIFDVAGHISKTFAVVSEFGIGPLKMGTAQFQLFPDPNFGTGSPAVAGLLSVDILEYYDVDFDFASNRLNLFSQDHCEDKVVYWHPKATAIIPLKLEANHLVIPVTVDGQVLQAIIDTGAPVTTMSLPMAKRYFNLTPQSPDMTAAGEITKGDASTASYWHNFSSLSFEGVAVSNPRLAIMPDVVTKQDRDNHTETGSRIAKIDDAATLPQLIIGMDILKKLHVYIAFKDRKMYITDASAPSTLPAPVPAPAN